MASLLREAKGVLQAAAIDSPELTADRLLAHVLGCDRADLYAAPQRPLSPRQKQAFARLLARRLRHEPLQYVVGEAEFMGLVLQVTPEVLIPRPETETMVERVLDFCKRELAGLTTIRCLDVGTGSGNIAAVLATSLSQAEVVAVDRSPQALRVARRNFQRLGVATKVRTVQADVRGQDFVRKAGRPFHLVVANLPYVPSAAVPSLQPEVRNHEPLLALDGGEDGLELYRALVPALPQLLTAEGAFFAEVGEGQAAKLSQLVRATGLRNIAVFMDLAGAERVVFAQK